MKHSRIILTLLTLLGCMSSYAMTNLTVDQLLTSYIDVGEPGCNVAVVNKNDSKFYSRGLASIEYQVPLTSDTKMLMASTSKQFVGYAILALAQQGVINLTDSLNKYLPEYKQYQDVKIFQLLNHSSGVRSHWGIFEMMGKSLFDQYRPAMVEEVLLKQPTDFIAQQRYLYSNGGYFLLTQIIEQVTRQSFAKYMSDKVFLPLGMSDSFYMDDYTQVIKNRADGYLINENNEFAAMRTHSQIVGPGHVITTTKDMAKWATMLLNSDLARQFQSLYQLAESNQGGKVNYFAGLFKESFHGETVYHHAGYYENWRQGFNVYPEAGVAIVSLCNRADISTNKFNYHIAQQLFSWPVPEIAQASQVFQPENAGLYYSAELNELVELRLHKGQLYYRGPTNSAYAKLSYDNISQQFHGMGFQQNSVISLIEGGINFTSPLISGKFEPLVFNDSASQVSEYSGHYLSDHGFIGFELSTAEHGIVLMNKKLGAFEFKQTRTGLWVELESLSTMTLSKVDGTPSLSLSLKHMKNLSYYQAK